MLTMPAAPAVGATVSAYLAELDAEGIPLHTSPHHGGSVALSLIWLPGIPTWARVIRGSGGPYLSRPRSGQVSARLIGSLVRTGSAKVR